MRENCMSGLTRGRYDRSTLWARSSRVRQGVGKILNKSLLALYSTVHRKMEKKYFSLERAGEKPWKMEWKRVLTRENL